MRILNKCTHTYIQIIEGRTFKRFFYYLFKLVIELNGTEYPERVDEVVERLVVEYMDGVRELNKDTIDGFLEVIMAHNKCIQ